MTVKEKIIEKIEKMDDTELSEIYQIVEEFTEKKDAPSLMEQLRQIKISADPDFSIKASIYPYPPEENEK